jgi:hypothetical protein
MSLKQKKLIKKIKLKNNLFLPENVVFLLKKKKKLRKKKRKMKSK